MKRIAFTLYDNISALMIISPPVLLKIRNVSDTFVEKSKEAFYSQNIFF
jgi:hypothetical protein